MGEDHDQKSLALRSLSTLALIPRTCCPAQSSASTRLSARKPTYAKFDANGLLIGWTTDATVAGVTMTSNGDKALILNGLDAGTYHLEETKAPDGYNKLTAPVTVTITEEGKVNETTNGTVYVSNNAGATLPSTGGMGTTLFYVIAAA